MKSRVIVLFITVTILCCQQNAEGNFKSEKVSKTASFIIHSNIETVFPLFGAFEERKWAPHWEPILIYPDKEIIEEGTTFKIDGHGHGHGVESEYLWIVTKYNTQSHLIQYLVSTDNRFWTITVQCKRTDSSMKTEATVTYSYISLNEEGTELNKKNIEKMYQNDLQDWAEAINNYLQKR